MEGPKDSGGSRGGLTGGYIIVSELEKEGVEYAEYTQKTVMAHIGRVIYRSSCLVFARDSHAHISRAGDLLFPGI